VDTLAMWLKCNSTPPFRVDSRQCGSNHCARTGALSLVIARVKRDSLRGSDLGHVERASRPRVPRGA
jgi:hypothetical protein